MERINKYISAAKPTAYNPQGDCYNFNAKSKLSNGDRVKVGNRRIDASTIQRLRAEQGPGMKINSITTNSRKIIINQTKIEDMEDPFTRRPTRPTRMGVRKVSPEKPAPAQEDNEQVKPEIQSNAAPSTTFKRSSESLERQPEQKKIKLTIATERTVEGKANKVTIKILTSRN